MLDLLREFVHKFGGHSDHVEADEDLAFILFFENPDFAANLDPAKPVVERVPDKAGSSERNPGGRYFGSVSQFRFASANCWLKSRLLLLVGLPQFT